MNIRQLNENPSDQLGNELKMKLWKVDHLQKELTQISESFENCVVTLDDLRSQNADLKQQNQKYIQNINDLQNNVVMLTTEIERMNSLLRLKVPEMEEYKLRSIHFEQQTRQSTVQVTEYQSQLLQVTREMERLNQIIHQKLFELEDSQTKITQYQFQIKNHDQSSRALSHHNEEMKNKMYDYETRIQEHENRTVLLAQEVERLNRVHEEQRRNFTTEINTLSKFEVEYQKIYQILEIKQTELKECNSYLMRKEQEFSQYRNQDEFLRELQNKLINEENRNRQTLDEQHRQNQEISIQNQKLTQKTNDLQNNLVMLTNEVERLNSILRQKVPEAEEYKMRAIHLEQQSSQSTIQITEYQNKLQQATREMERLNSIIHQKLYELEDSQIKLAQFQSQSKNNEINNKSMILHIDELKEKMHHSELNQREFENSTVILSQEVERLNKVLEEKKKNLNLEISKKLQLKTNEIEDWISKYKRLEVTFQQYRGIEEKQSHYQQRIIVLCVEIERLGLIHVQIANECGQINEQNQQFQFNLKSKDEQIFKTTERNKLLQNLIEEDKNKFQVQQQDLLALRAFQDKCIGYEQRMIVSSQEIERMSVIYKQKCHETDEIKQRVSIYENQITQLTTVSQKTRDYENKIVLVSQENERLNSIIFSLKKENDDFSIRYQQMEQRYHYATQSCEDYKLKLVQIEIQLGQMINMKNKVIDLENKIVLLTSEIERLISTKNQETETFRITIYNLEEKVIKFKSYEENVRILSQEIDRLSYIVEQQDQELRVWRLQFADGGQQNKKIQDLQVLLVMSFVEVESLRARVFEKEKEVEDVRRSSLAPYRR